jgi:hypothetical protein
MMRHARQLAGTSARYFALVAFVVSLALVQVASATTLAPGSTDAVMLTGTAGGDMRAVRFGNTDSGFCTGWISSTPSHVVTLDSDFAGLVLEVNAPADTTLVVLGPNGTRCNDDTSDDNENPRINGSSWPAGEYRIYVGAYDEGQRVRYTLTIRPI